MVNYRVVYVQDADDPDGGWAYVHVDDFEVDVGDTVEQGQLLARVRFQGIEHIHLSRLRRVPGTDWTEPNSLPRVQPDGWFEYADSEPPILEAPFRFFRNQRGEEFERGSPTVVRGDVDIVVGMRDPGEHARPPGGYATDDRLAVSRIEYDITDPDGQTTRHASFDFSRLIIPVPAGGAGYEVAATVFAHYGEVLPGSEEPWWQRRISYYIITNSPDPAREGLIDPEDARFAWRTADGPDGDHVITVRAFDFLGNVSSRADTVRVDNGGAWTGAPSR